MKIQDLLIALVVAAVLLVFVRGCAFEAARNLKPPAEPSNGVSPEPERIP